MLTAVVVLPTPPFWLATTITRVWSGRGSGVPWGTLWRTSSCWATARAIGVDSS